MIGVSLHFVVILGYRFEILTVDANESDHKSELEIFSEADAWNHAESTDQPDIIEYLLENKPKQIQMPDYAYSTPKYKLLSKNIHDQFNESWFWNINNGDVKTIKIFEKHVKDINIKNKSGQTALHIACNQSKHVRNETIINYLKQNIKQDVKDDFGCMALDYLKTYKFVLVSDSGGIGKESLINQFMNNNHDETAGGIQSKYVYETEKDFGGHIFNIRISEEIINDDYKLSNASTTDFDTQRGVETVQLLNDEWAKENDIFVLLFPINNAASFRQMRIIRHTIIQKKTEHQTAIATIAIIPIILVGTKCDLKDEMQITANEINEKCKEWNGKKYPNANAKHLFIKTSVKENLDVADIFVKGIKLYCKLKHDSHTIIANKFETNM